MYNKIEMTAKYLSSFNENTYLKLFEYCENPKGTNKVSSNDVNWISFTVTHKNKDNFIQKSFYVDANSTIKEVKDLTGKLSNNFELFLAKENTTTDTIWVCMKPSLPNSYTFLEVNSCGLIGMFEFNYGGEYFDAINNLTILSNNTPQPKNGIINFMNGYSDYSNMAKSHLKISNNFAELSVSVKGTNYADKDVIININTPPLRPFRTQCVLWNGSKYINGGFVSMEANGDIVLNDLPTDFSIRRIDFQCVYLH